jgi:hypothetical protein
MELVLCVSAFSQEAVKMQEIADPTCEYYLSRIDDAIAASENNPSAAIYVFVYEGKELKYSNRKNKMEKVLPTFGSAKAKINSMKKRISKFLLQRFTFVEAGFRETLTVEFWLVPVGATVPKPTPTLAKMKYRKGKATGFCLGCCENYEKAAF